ncbi:MAG: Eco57I restriction-modification methylase domain-containing protein [Desulfomonilaceae bacterium]
MNSNVNPDTRFDHVMEVFLEFIRHLLGSNSFRNWTADRLYTYALEALTRAFLEDIEETHSQIGANWQIINEKLSLRLFQLGPLAPEEVGQLYESLRGFRLEIKSGNEPILLPSPTGKRNQGLFYTPLHIVEQIVTGALDAIGISQPEDYLDLKILDPAVGTGVFLAHALEEVTRRVFSSSSKSSTVPSSRIETIHNEISAALSASGTGNRPKLEESIRIHILTSCLYGVDLDPIAAHIAQVVLTKRVFGHHPPPDGFSLNIRTGNSLIGAIRTTPYPYCQGDRRWRKMENSSMEEFQAEPDVNITANLDRMHAVIYFAKKNLHDRAIQQWSEEKKVFHWSLEFPEVFQRDRDGFDIVIGNPPYEIISVKESGIRERTKEQTYFRSTYRTCQGKINTYRLMTERGLELLRDFGALGIIVPATLLADSTAEKLRRMILDETGVYKMIIIPEKAQVFRGVTQAFLILITRKSAPTGSLQPVRWDPNCPAPLEQGIEISRRIIEAAGFRVPLIRSLKERDLFEALTRFPPLAGNRKCSAIGRVHQGEINLTTHRDFITNAVTGHPLIRGEHVSPLRVLHPSPGGHKLDWILPEFVERQRGYNGSSRPVLTPSRHLGQTRFRGKPWKMPRIVIGRVVNMDTRRRLKAAAAPSGAFLGDMTNFIFVASIPTDYMLGLLNSRLLNWRFRITSTNNYISASEIEALPIPRIPEKDLPEPVIHLVRAEFEKLQLSRRFSISEYLNQLQILLKVYEQRQKQFLLTLMLEWVVQTIMSGPPSIPGEGLWNLLDAVVILLYGASSYISIIENKISAEF